MTCFSNRVEPRGKSVSVMFTCRDAFFIGGKTDWSGERMGGSMCFLKC
ncbi:hypothetical protein B4140_0142 [Bacillus amyloliquefaciens]|nr:hypothetical protein B4140_0142 [Bacillus amyloliquefaciens]